MADPIYIIPDQPEYRLDIRKLQNSDPANADTVFNPLVQAILENIHHLKAAQGTLDYIPNAEKGEPGGVAILGPDGKIPMDQLQATAASLNFGETSGVNGLWDRQTAVPTGTQAIRYNGYLRATRVYGMYYSDAADYAEAYLLSEAVAAGELVAIGPGGALRRNAVRGNPRVLGIVSSEPAAVIGGQGTPVALAGRVPARVVGPVSAGDLLMGSAVPGALERAVDPPRGAVVGQALEDFGGDGVISVLVVRM